MNILVIGKENLLEYLEYTNIFKDHYHLDNFNMSIATTKEGNYENITNCIIDFEDETFHDIRIILKKHRWHLIIIDLNIDNYNYLTNIIPKFSKADIMLISNDKISFTKYGYKLIPFGTLKSNIEDKSKALNYGLSLCFLDNLYHIDVLKAPILFENKLNIKIIKEVKKIENNPYNSNINHLKLCFFNNFCFIDDLYFYNRCAYLLDESDDIIENKIAATNKKYDIYFIKDDKTINKDKIKLLLPGQVVFLENDNYNYQDIYSLIINLVKKQ